jgi:DNA-binding IscR family transcriptional regulator
VADELFFHESGDEMLVGRNRSGQSRRILCVIARQRPGTSDPCAFEREKLEVLAVIVDGDTRFAIVIVILEHQRVIGAAPEHRLIVSTVHKLKTVPKNFILAVNCYMYYDNMSRINNQFSVGVHIMTALGDHHGEQVTSAHLTASVRAHDSRVRSVLSKLVKAGLVVTSRGRNGFSSLSRPANKISLLEIYKAVGAPPVFSIHEYPKEKTCRTSCTHKQAMVELLGDTQRAFEARLGQRMLSQMVAKARSYK